jgi:hypothetical protein
MIPRAGDQPIVTLLVATLFVMGLLYKNWIGEIRDWIETKVAEGGGTASGGQSPSGAYIDPSTGKWMVPNPTPGQPPLSVYG